MITNMKIMSGLIAATAWMSVSSVAKATTIITPFGPADDSCVHEIPRGGGVDAQTGDVALNGATVSHIAPCTVSPTSTGSAHPPTTGGWYEYSNTNATTIEGLTQFDYLDVSWSVPTTPSNPDSSLTYLFPSLNAPDPPGQSLGMILQPVLQWGIGPDGGGNDWLFAAWGLWGCDAAGDNCSVGYSTPYETYAGYSLEGIVQQYAGNLDAWNVSAIDNTQDLNYNFYIYNIPNSWPKFTTAQTGVLEAYNICCNNLSPSDGIGFSLNGLYQAGPDWNSFNDVTGTAAFSGFKNPFNYAPHCTFTPTVSNYYTILTWNYEADPACD